MRFYFGNDYVAKVSDRINVISGDITSGISLGINSKDLHDVIKNVSCIINSGAIVKHFGQKKLFEDINVVGTKNTIDFCKKYKCYKNAVIENTGCHCLLLDLASYVCIAIRRSYYNGWLAKMTKTRRCFSIPQ